MRSPDGVGAVREAHRFDEAALAGWMREHVEGVTGDIAVQQFKGGQSNPTFLVDVTMDGGVRRLVVRKKPPGKLLPSAHAVEREYRVIRALRDTDVPVPNALALCEDPAIIGTPFYVMEFVKGRVLRDMALPGFEPDGRRAIYAAMIDTLAKLHGVDVEAVGLGDYGKKGNYFARQIGRWSKQYVASKTEDIEPMDRLMAWLPENIPAGDETAIAHGDFRMENLIYSDEGSENEPRVIAVLDWELSTLGHPLADLGYNCMAYYLPQPLGGLAGVKLEGTGIPTEREVVAMYCDRTGRDGVPNWSFYLAFSFFRIAAIMQGVYKRSLQGNAASSRAGQYGHYARILAGVAWDLAQRDDG